jgi:hypothetical protein
MPTAHAAAARRVMGFCTAMGALAEGWAPQHPLLYIAARGNCGDVAQLLQT